MATYRRARVQDRSSSPVKLAGARPAAPEPCAFAVSTVLFTANVLGGTKPRPWRMQNLALSSSSLPCTSEERPRRTSKPRDHAPRHLGIAAACWDVVAVTAVGSASCLSACVG